MLSLVFLFIQLFFALLVFYLCIAFVTGAPYVPSTNPTAEAMVNLARIKKNRNVFDLGSGDGKLLALAQKKGAKVTGLEINPILVLYSRLLGRPAVWKNFWNYDLSPADIVFVYLLPWRMQTLAAKLKKELKPGSLVVSNSFIFPNWKILRQDKTNHVYVYKV